MRMLVSAGASSRKFLRYAGIYGPSRTLFKAAGRLRISLPYLALQRPRKDIAVIGCGQFAFSTIAYFLQRTFGRRIAACYDIDFHASRSFARAMGVPKVCNSIDELLAQPALRIVYIASNHASHAPYAVSALQRGLDVYVEKPIAVSQEQLVALIRARRDSPSRIFCGYNRPFSAAVRELHQQLRRVTHEGITLQCFVAGHQIGPDHWYRRPEEGTRVCGNIGHWLDLLIHMLAWRGLPDRLDVSLTWANEMEPDDNVCIVISSDRHDLFSLMLTSHNEPFEGINETINFQHADTTCKIDDFRRMTLWQGPRLLRRQFWPKDVGHKLAVLQPFSSDVGRDWHEVVLSTLLMLQITEMVRNRTRAATFSLTEGWAELVRELEVR